MSRVSYVMMHPEGAEEMTKAIREALNKCCSVGGGCLGRDLRYPRGDPGG